MKATRLGELRELLQGPPFGAWWQEFQRAVIAVREARLHADETAAQAELMQLRAELTQRSAADVFGAVGETEELAARAGVEAQSLENRALEIVGTYEEQRTRTSDTWLRLGAAERAVEAAREGTAARRPEAAAALEGAERTRKQLQAEYEAEDARRTRLWADVEGTWEKAFSRSLAAAETASRIRAVRREAERLFKEADERRDRAKQLREEADAARRALEAAERRRLELLGRAADSFGCAAGEAFLYWRCRDDQLCAYALSLVDDAEGFNVPVKALDLFSVGRQRGVGFLEPARDGQARGGGEGERRFEALLRDPTGGTGGSR
jgi:hypothetical protein